jgi:MFS superfamily sulfate permease-like transporter/CRP-like cAMP-binding protein
MKQLPDAGGNKMSPLQKSSEESASRFFDNVISPLVYGCINSILTVPCTIGYAAIIFRDPAFHDVFPALVKLVLFSSVVHQCMFTWRSTLPFAIGQVQDAGLIFLSAMASKAILVTPGELDEKIATAVVTLSLGTALLGLGLVVVGRLRLASMVAYLPMPVVGGYLGYIGEFCLLAGLSIATNAQFTDVFSLWQLGEPKLLLLATPAVLCGLLMLFVSRKVAHFAALPALMVAIPTVFYIVLAATGTTLEEAREAGWVQPTTKQVPFYQMWYVFDFTKVHWSTMPGQLLTWIGMFFVVAFSSCLDVAAIEMDMGKQLNVNHELGEVVGWSNFVSGITGGFTGSYIFSQTVFTYRTCRNRLVGVLVIISEATVVIVPASPLAFVPSFFFAAVLIFIAFDLMDEWIIQIRPKMLFQEYLVLLGSFVAINALGLEVGMLIGLLLAAFNFVLGYARSPAVRTINRRSLTVRAPSEQVALFWERDELQRLLTERESLHRVSSVSSPASSPCGGAARDGQLNLQLHDLDPLRGGNGRLMPRGTVSVLELRGYIFFGSSLQILNHLKTTVAVLAPDSAAATGAREDAESGIGGGEYGSTAKSLPLGEKAAGGGGPDAVVGSRLVTLEGKEIIDEGVVATRMVVFDFSLCEGVDATAITGCFFIAKQLLLAHGIPTIWAGASEQVLKLLTSNRVMDSAIVHTSARSAFVARARAEAQAEADAKGTGDVVDTEVPSFAFPELGIALDYCETELLQAHKQQRQDGKPTPHQMDGSPELPPGPLPEVASRRRLAQVIDKYCAYASAGAPGNEVGGRLSNIESDTGVGRRLAEFMELRSYGEGEVIYGRGDTCDCFYIVVEGEAELFTITEDDAEREAGETGEAMSTTASASLESWLSNLRGRLGRVEQQQPSMPSALPFARVCDEGLFGEEHFPSTHFLRMVTARASAPLSGSAGGVSSGCTCAMMTRSSFDAMAAAAPDLVAVILQMITRALSTKLDTSWLNEGVLRQ